MKTAEELKELIPYETARRAHYWTSFTPDERAKQTQEYFASTVLALFDILKSIDESRLDEIELDIERFTNALKNKTLNWLTSKSRTASAAITGPANFNYDRNNKRLEIERRRNQEIADYIEKTKKYLMKKYKPVEELDLEKEFKEYYLTNDEGIYNMELIKKGLERRLLKEVKEGRGQKVIEALEKDNYRIFTKRHKIHKEIENLMEVKTTSETIKGVEVIDNVEAQRIQLIFEGKPSEDIRTYLKKHAWKWSPKNTAWQNFRKPERLKQIKDYLKNI